MDTDAWLKGGLSEVLRLLIVQTDLRDRGRDRRRLFRCADLAARMLAPVVAKAAGLEDCARELQALIPIADPLTAKAAGNLLSTVSLRATENLAKWAEAETRALEEKLQAGLVVSEAALNVSRLAGRQRGIAISGALAILSSVVHLATVRRINSIAASNAWLLTIALAALLVPEDELRAFMVKVAIAQDDAPADAE
jgi:hypothetical protein